MKVPASSPQNIHNNNNITTNNNQNMGFHSNPPKVCYEPTSVLDLRRSPSPAAAAAKPVVSAPADPLEWDDHVLHAFDWDSIMKELDFNDDSSGGGSISNIKSTFAQFNNYNNITPSDHSHTQTVPNLSEFLEPSSQVTIDPSQLSQNLCFPDNYNYNDLVNTTPTLNLSTASLDHRNNYNNYSFSFDAIQELIRAADCIDSNDLHLAHVILERLNPRLQSPIGKPLQRAAFFFKEALHNFLLSGSNRSTTSFSSWSEIVQIVRAYKLFSTISPIPMFTHFTINQAMLETLVEGSPPLIHVIDFDIGLGCHYASFMRELSEKAHSSFNKPTSPFLRITAIVKEEFAIKTKLIKESLAQFANELKIGFQIDFVLTRTFELLSFKAVKFMEREKTAILLTPTIIRSLSNSTTNFTAFVKDIRALKPDIVVFVDSEGWSESGATSFRRGFVNGLEFYSMMFESLDAAVAGGEWVKKIEMLLMKPRISAAVEGSGRRVVMQPWREALVGCGFRAVGLSQFADFQADCLLRKVQVRGFYVAKRGSELVLCWHQRPLIATSAWKC